MAVVPVTMANLVFQRIEDQIRSGKARPRCRNGRHGALTDS
jgi:hypothetical protein